MKHFHSHSWEPLRETRIQSAYIDELKKACSKACSANTYMIYYICNKCYVTIYHYHDTGIISNYVSNLNDFEIKDAFELTCSQLILMSILK